jgi:NAD(P)-dependent dehydrogenase (short-subunit alcohol dehydrogenase family)
LGKAIAKEVVQQGYELTIVVRNQNKADLLAHLHSKVLIADATQ